MNIIPLYLSLYLYIILFDLIPIKKNNYKMLFAFNLIVICISFLIVVLVGLGLNVPNPSNLIEDIVKFFIS